MKEKKTFYYEQICVYSYCLDIYKQDVLISKMNVRKGFFFLPYPSK